MAIWIPDLSNREGPKYLQIVEVMAEDIATGRLLPGARLLPHRELAYQLNVSPNTTSRAYAEAVKRALLRGEVGRGTFVRSVDADLSPAEPETLLRSNTGPVDLSRNLPMPGFSEHHIRRAMSDIANDTGLRSLLDYQTDADLAHHRAAGQTWLNECGLDADMDCVVPVVGGQHGILCALMALLQPGDLLLSETLTYTPVLEMAARLNLQTGAVAMDAQGVIPEAFEAWCRNGRPKAFYLTPTLQAPTTVTLSDERRVEIARIAERYGVILIEDDVFGPLKRNKPAPISRSAPGNTVYVTSLSKSVAPGLRVGFLYAPKKLAPALRQSVNLSVWMTPPMTLEVASRLIEDGSAAKLTEVQQRTAIHRQKLVQHILGAEAVQQMSDGFHVWLQLPDGWRADVFSAECARLGAYVSEGRSFALNASDAPEAVRICVSHESQEDRLRQGLEVIAGVLRQKPSGSSMVI
ncbi:PLP-dependent aminotransferase family protein [Ruegeria lacuscaerulensis]|uniref:aminotransferase-like domain-containing protein n=1 Tax=Ruegeria lacuscaerulensis TaxID=55218 RepID=UPI00147A3F82|nr:PLP-dependent aminotransferase family protein [Ruegeria lacuscaerulensis]